MLARAAATALPAVSFRGHSINRRRRYRLVAAKQIGSYAALIPSEDSSGGKQRLGHISKQGNSLLRFLLVEAAQAAVRCNPDWRRRYRNLAMRRQRNIAKVAMGRQLGVRGEEDGNIRS